MISDFTKEKRPFQLFERSQTLATLPGATLQVGQHEEVVNWSYLRRADVEPILIQNADGLSLLEIHNQGEYGQFELPYIASHLVAISPSLVAVLIAFHGTEPFGRRNHQQVTKGQFWRFYGQSGDLRWHTLPWRSLTDEQREIVLTAYLEQSPVWATAPGKLRTASHPPQRTKLLTYKLVREVDGRYYSIYKPDEEYVLGEMKYQEARPHHAGGYFSYPERELLMKQFQRGGIFVSSKVQTPMRLALLEVSIGGTIIKYDSGKWASSSILPVAVLDIFDFPPN
jgi:hypothetical protein